MGRFNVHFGMRIPVDKLNGLSQCHMKSLSWGDSLRKTSGGEKGKTSRRISCWCKLISLLYKVQHSADGIAQI